MSKKTKNNPKLEKKSYLHKEEEQNLFQEWQEKKLYRFNTETDKKIYTIDTPPPYTNASWHIGGAIHYSQIDMIARTMRMKGLEVHFPMGLDRNGLPIEIQTEKENSIKMQDTDRGEFIQLCKNLLNRYGDQILDLAYRLGLSNNSFEWNEVYKTDEEQYRAITQASFIDLFNRGLIYEDDKPSNWDPLLQTTVADAEIEYREGKHTLYEIEFTIPEIDETFTISTSRPELLPAIGVVIYHPSDVRYKKYENKQARIPIWNLEAPILAHPSADPNFGRGIMMICSFGDITDIRIFRELNLKPKYLINPDGTLNDLTGEKYTGLSITKARKIIVKDLKKINKIKNEEIVPHRFPISERSHAKLEFIGMPELYLQQESFVKKLKKYANKLKFLPEKSKQIWLDWLDKISMDWPITRRRFYGTEVPLWYCNECNETIVPKGGPYYQPWKDPAPVDKCPKCFGTSFKGESRIFDTWMDSSISAYYILKYPHNKPVNQNFTDKLQDREYICDIRPQGKDIVRTWLHYSMLRGYLLFNQPMFKQAWISGHVVTDKGEKMSKSKGNSIDPMTIIEKYGGDALRLFGASEVSHGSDLRFSETKLSGISKFLNKLYNIARFISSFAFPDDFTGSDLVFTDKWILSELAEVSDKALRGYDSLNFHIPARELYQFTWETFASTYLELVKKRAYNRNNEFSSGESKSAIWTLYKCLESMLKLFAPIIPFITDYIYLKLYNKSIHTESFPEILKYDEITSTLTECIIALNSLIWKLKESNKPPIARREQIKTLILPEEMKPLENDLISYHNVENTYSETEKPKKYELVENIFVYIDV
jgi:valyl-tRNA synthetase